MQEVASRGTSISGYRNDRSKRNDHRTYELKPGSLHEEITAVWATKSPPPEFVLNFEEKD